jgi:nucleoside-diphosphate-sugar epimerase
MKTDFLPPAPEADVEHILVHTRDLWEKLRGQSLFITGGTGFFGRWLLESFVAANRRFQLNAQAVVLSRDPEAFQSRAQHLAADPSVRLVRGDVRTLEVSAVRQQLNGSTLPGFSFVIHAASETSLPANQNNPVAVLENLFEGTRRVLELAVHTGAKSFLLASSGAVYGDQPPELNRVDEGYLGAPDVTSPLAAYGEGKRLAELLCVAYQRKHGLNCKIARGFAFVGPFLALDAHYAVGNFIRDVVAGQAIRLTGDGTPVRSYLYAADLAIWLWTILLNPDARGPYNVGSDEAHSILQVADCVSRHSPQPLSITLAQPAQPGRPPRRYVPDVSRARRELGLQVWTSLEAAVQKTIQFYEQAKPIFV